MSEGLRFLSSEDFRVEKGAKGDVMCTFIRGFSLILFYSTECVYCEEFVPFFKQLPDMVNGCTFGMINVSLCQEIIEMSSQTILPLQYVPLLVLYVDGRPYMKYEGPLPSESNDNTSNGEAKEAIRHFIFEAAANIKNKQKFTEETKQPEQQPQVPAYCIGKPVCSVDMSKKCYLTFDSAYQKK